jgi:hypothetical protein
MIDLNAQVSNTNAPNVGAGLDYGSFKNDVSPGDHTGTPFVEIYMNDVVYALYAVLKEAAITPSGVKETTAVSDFLTALKKLIVNNNFDPSDIKVTFSATPKIGWMLWTDSTIGSATSGADRANSDTQALFTELWNSVSNTYCSVSGGRGVSAAADWAANKTLQLPPTNGRTLVNVAGGTYSLAEAFGEATHTLIVTELPSHNHSALEGDFIYDVGSGGNVAVNTGANATDNKSTTADTGGDGAHNNLQPSTAVYFHIKL